MITKLQRFYQSLPGRFPLAWNTRIFHLIPILTFIHLAFGIAGYLSLGIKQLTYLNGISEYGGQTLIQLSILLSVAVLVGWLVWLLRNNPFKSFYPISRSYLFKQFSLIFLLTLASCSFYESFYFGASLKVKRLIPQKKLVEQVNTVNLALGFVPLNLADYFVYNNCASDTSVYDLIRYLHSDVNSDSYSEEDRQKNLEIRNAALEPGGISVNHYCRSWDYLKYQGFEDRFRQQATRQRWMQAQQKDSILQSVQALAKLFQEYRLSPNYDWDSIYQINLEDTSLIGLLLPLERAGDDYSSPSVRYLFEKSLYKLQTAFELADEQYFRENTKDSRKLGWHILGYFVVCIAVAVFGYRLFSRWVFLASIIAGIGLFIILILIESSSYNNKDAPLYYLLIVFFLWLLTALGWANVKTPKKIWGMAILLSAGSVILVVPNLLILLKEALESKRDAINLEFTPQFGYAQVEHLLKERHPYLCWVSSNAELLIALNILLVFLLIAWVLPILARRWQGRPEE